MLKNGTCEVFYEEYVEAGTYYLEFKGYFVNENDSVITLHKIVDSLGGSAINVEGEKTITLPPVTLRPE